MLEVSASFCFLLGWPRTSSSFIHWGGDVQTLCQTTAETSNVHVVEASYKNGHRNEQQGTGNKKCHRRGTLPDLEDFIVVRGRKPSKRSFESENGAKGTAHITAVNNLRIFSGHLCALASAHFKHSQIEARDERDWVNDEDNLTKKNAAPRAAKYHKETDRISQKSAFLYTLPDGKITVLCILLPYSFSSRPLHERGKKILHVLFSKARNPG
ncbi:hypothetical protein DFH08DRAFT_815221 [Mycena albidolilacea]|uniref:Uncharacterized protein n=1 Tax=Mycena albidolilacea TaxID=1033008 RepID=A0AAD6ZMH2_9AGAR|nr:hypothetical protein DFH08DRAFT_815221 [Mycena albidolilacea]